jgi:leucyl-tRNA---protein transferase
MKIALSYVSAPERCGYLPEQTWRLRYDVMESITLLDYQKKMADGWRRFGYSLFKPNCETCSACLSLRVNAEKFKPNRSQQRAFKQNHDLRLSIGSPQVDDARLELYDRFHRFQAEVVGWPLREPESVSSYYESFVDNPFQTQEWCYYLGDQLVGVGYVDNMPQALSAIYFYYEPELKSRSLGTFNVLSIIDNAKKNAIPYAYLGYYVEGCRSLEYKANFKPNEVLSMKKGTWELYRELEK